MQRIQQKHTVANNINNKTSKEEKTNQRNSGTVLRPQRDHRRQIVEEKIDEIISKKQPFNEWQPLN